MSIPQLILQSCAFEIINSNTNESGVFDVENEPKLESGTNFTNLINNFSQEIIEEESKSSDVPSLKLSSDFSQLIFNIYNIFRDLSSEGDFTQSDLQKLLEAGIIEENLDSQISSQAASGLTALKPMGIELQRSKPSEWNELLDICMS